MKLLLPIVVLSVTMPTWANVTEISFVTDDGVTVYGEIYRGETTPGDAPLILLFHQGASNSRAEYRALVPRLLENGYNLLAIDQRRGGNRFGGSNRTLAGVGDREYSYCEVYPDMEGALRFARSHGLVGRTVAWGSSYSAALAFKLGVEHADEIDAVIAFSPASGEPMEGCMPEPFSAEIRQPLLVLRPHNELQLAWIAEQMRLFEEHGHRIYVADPGVHGSSMLNEARVGASTEATWTVVLDFLRRALTVVAKSE